MGSVGEEVPMTRLDEIKERLGKAPKELAPGDGSCMGEDFDLNEHTFHSPAKGGFGVYVYQFSGPAEDFYLHTPTDITWLLGEVERLREANRALLAAAEGVLADAVEEMAGEEGVA